MSQLFKRTNLLIAIGLLLLSLFIWYAGPFFAFRQWHPLEPQPVRWVLIALLVAAWPACVLWKQWQALRKGGALAQVVVAKSSTPSPDVTQLRERFEQEVAKLRNSEAGRRGLYELPWYAIIGAPGSGKTTVLLNSGLHFPLEQRSGRGALRGIGGTRNCDWWFTDEAVLLDTAGRYTTQDSDAAADSAGWSEFLAL